MGYWHAWQPSLTTVCKRMLIRVLLEDGEGIAWIPAIIIINTLLFNL